MSLIGHVYPALFYVGVGTLMLGRVASALRASTHHAHAQTQTQTPPHPLHATNGGSGFVFLFGVAVMLVTFTGITVEAIGGALTQGNALFQAAHQSIHLAFFLSGAGAVLESYKRAPLDTWRGLIGVGFLVQAIVFYGHQQEQLAPESTMHFVLALASSLVAVAAFASTWQPRAVLLHLVTVAGVIFHGLWLTWIGVVVYTPTFGVPAQIERERDAKRMGRDSPSMAMDMSSASAEEGLMPADVYLHAGFALVVVVAFIGAVLSYAAGRPWSESHHDVAEHVRRVQDQLRDEAAPHPDFSFPPTVHDWSFASVAAFERAALARSGKESPPRYASVDEASQLKALGEP